MTGYVYLVRNGDLHKIGHTDNVQRRMQQLKPDEVVQVLATDRSRNLEHELHIQFKDKRIPQTEYFRLNEGEVEEARMALGWEKPLPQIEWANPGNAGQEDQRELTVIRVMFAAVGVPIVLAFAMFSCAGTPSYEPPASCGISACLGR